MQRQTTSGPAACDARFAAAQDFRTSFPAAVALPIWCSVGHVLICALDYGYVAFAVTYVPANLLLAGVRTWVHCYADPQHALMLYANVWAAVHVLGAVHGVISALQMMAVVPVCSPVVFVLSALWGVTCTVEGAVLKLPIPHRLLGHACVIIGHISAPPMSLLGQPTEVQGPPNGPRSLPPNGTSYP